MLVQGSRKLSPLVLSGTDQLLDSWADYVLIFDQQLELSTLIEKLKFALDINPYFAGRKFSEDGVTTCISGGNEGVLLEFESFSCPRPDGFIENDYTGYDLFCDSSFRSKHRLSRSSYKHALFQVKLSTFESGSVLGISVWHCMADGTTFFNFLELLGSSGGGVPDFTRLPVADSSLGSKLVRIDDSAVGVLSESFEEITCRLSSDDVAKIVKGYECESFMVYDFLAAFFWKKIAQAGDATKALLYPVYDARSLTELPLNTMGNLLCYPVITETLECLSAQALDVTASLIREGTFDLVACSDELMGELAANSAHAMQEPKGGLTLKPLYDSWYGKGLLFNNLMSIPWKNFDLTGHPPVHLDMPLSDGLRFLQLYPCLSQTGSISVKINLPASEMTSLKAALVQEGMAV